MKRIRKPFKRKPTAGPNIGRYDMVHRGPRRLLTHIGCNGILAIPHSAYTGSKNPFPLQVRAACLKCKRLLGKRAQRGCLGYDTSYRLMTLIEPDYAAGQDVWAFSQTLIPEEEVEATPAPDPPVPGHEQINNLADGFVDTGGNTNPVQTPRVNEILQKVNELERYAKKAKNNFLAIDRATRAKELRDGLEAKVSRLVKADTAYIRQVDVTAALKTSKPKDWWGKVK